MATDSIKNVVVITPSLLLARGLEAALPEAGEFKVVAIMSDLGKSNCSRLAGIDADIVLIDPSVMGEESRRSARTFISEYTQAPVLAILSSPQNEEVLSHFDASASIFDTPQTFVKKMRELVGNRQDTPRPEGDELSAREKEILVCVAKGMLNKEIADMFSISIYTVITHRKNITRKTGIKTVAGLTVYALLNNLIDINTAE